MKAVSAFAKYARKIAESVGSLTPYIATINEANMGIQLWKVSQDMIKAGKRKGGSVQDGQNTGLNMKAILLGMLEQGKAFRCSPFGVNSFLKPRNERQEKIVMQAHQAAVRAVKEVNPDIRTRLTLSLFDYQPVPGGEVQAGKLWQEDFGFYLPYIKDDDFVGVQNFSRKIVDASGARPPAKNAPVTQMGYEEYPNSIGNVLRKVAKEYAGELIVTENGIATEDDKRRCKFIRAAVADMFKIFCKRANCETQITQWYVGVTGRRKPCPTHEERFAAAERQIERLTKLNAERAALIEKTESTLSERRAALAKSEVALEAAKAKKERIIEAMNKPAKETKPKLSPEERAQRRRDALEKAQGAKKAEKEKYEALLPAPVENGKSVDDLLEELKK